MSDEILRKSLTTVTKKAHFTSRKPQGKISKLSRQNFDKAFSNIHCLDLESEKQINNKTEAENFPR